ncbi:hypothetical protein BV20DRAFT_1039069 [Pilatotrama ljubarskyi]|nr:hypothetical protein BV20DRAFT_1039069 [Pilatotrama ljubarskyi]
MSAVISVGEHWTGMESIMYLVVFGDSYSSVVYCTGSPHPSDENPLGVDFPGETSCGIVDEETQQSVSEPNWVGHFTREMRIVRTSHPLLVFYYAIAGDTVARLKLKQVGREFLPQLGIHPEWAPWTSSDTLFASLHDLFAAQDKLYKAGARNFCFVDVPAVHTFPKGPKTPRAKAAYQAWNPLLRQGAEAFSASHPDAAVFIFSSWALFSRILADPTDGRAALFVDGFRPSSAVHKVITKELISFLRTQKRVLNVTPATLHHARPVSEFRS